MSPRLELRLDRERYRAGETIRGSVLVAEGGRSRSLEVRLNFKEETEDYLDVAKTISTGQLHEGDLATGTSFDFELTLPQEALPGYKSAHGELYWDVDARSDELAGDTREQRRIVIDPASAT